MYCTGTAETIRLASRRAGSKSRNSAIAAARHNRLDLITEQQRLEDAERDGDHIYATILGIGGSSDGKGKGITAPNPVGQVLAISRAWQNAGLDPATATLVEETRMQHDLHERARVRLGELRK